MTHTDPHTAALSFQQGDEKGFNFFFNELYPALLYYAYRITGDRDNAKDAVSRSFVKIWENRETFHHPKQIKSWMYSTVRNDCLNILVGEKRKHKREENYWQLVKDDVQQSREYEIIRAEVMCDIHDMLKPLPCACKQVIVLYYFHGLNTMEISKRLGRAITTIKNQKLRGEKIIKSMAETGYKSKFKQAREELHKQIRESSLGIKEAADFFGMNVVSIYHIRNSHNAG